MTTPLLEYDESVDAAYLCFGDVADEQRVRVSHRNGQ
jgi:hypothetical protein